MTRDGDPSTDELGRTGKARRCLRPGDRVVERHTADLKGLQSPVPILVASQLARRLPEGTVLEIAADSIGFPEEIRAWCRRQGKVLLCCDTAESGRHRAEFVV